MIRLPIWFCSARPANNSGLLPTSRPKSNGLPASRISSTTSRSWFTLIGKHAAIFALVIEFGDGIAKGQVDRLDAVAQNVLKPDQQRKFQPARLRLLDHIGEIHRRAGVLQRLGDDVPGVVDVEVFRAPAVDVVQIAGGLDVPRLAGVGRIAHFDCLRSKRTIEVCAENSIRGMKIFLCRRFRTMNSECGFS